MRIAIGFVLILYMLFSTSCSTSASKLSSSKLTLSEVEELEVTESTMEEAHKKLRKPDLVVFLEHDQVAWLYLEGDVPTTRLSLIFDNTSKKLATINWFVKEADKESVVANAKDRYKNAQFVESSPEWTNSHVGPDELLFADKKKNLEIVFQKSTKKVSTIRWESSESSLVRRPSSKTQF